MGKGFKICSLWLFPIFHSYLIPNNIVLQKLRKRLAEYRKEDFVNGTVKSWNPHLGVEEQAHLLPYDNRWEFPIDKLELGNKLRTFSPILMVKFVTNIATTKQSMLYIGIVFYFTIQVNK